MSAALRASLAALAVLVITAVAAPAARANTVDVLVLRATSGGAVRAEDEIDHSVVRALVSDVGFARVEIARQPLADIALAAGCDYADPACMARIARASSAGVVLVRRLDSSHGTLSLQLVSFPASGRAPGFVAGRISRPAAPETQAVIGALVRRLYDVHPRADEPALRGERGPRVGLVTWTLLGASFAALSAGTIVGLMANDAASEHASLRIRNESDVDKAHSLHERAQDRAALANVLLLAGGVTGVAGVGLLVADLAGHDDEEPAGSHVEVVARPVWGGGMLMLHGASVGP